MIRLVRRTFPSSIEVERTTAPGAPAVLADAGQLQQVLMNLSINARDAMPDGGTLRYEVALLRGPEVRITVRDTGHAMPPEIRARIFEPFFTTKGTRGSGLGLAMVDGIVRQHDGRIEVESAVGVGSAFHLYLRATDAVAEVPERPVRSTRGSGTILLAEDDPMVRAVVTRVLREAGYEILEACDGMQAVELYEAHADRIALVLADVMMPRLTGREVYDRVATGGRRPRFLFTSGYSAELLGDGLLDRPGVALLRKPYRVEALLAKVREVLEG